MHGTFSTFFDQDMMLNKKLYLSSTYIFYMILFYSIYKSTSNNETNNMKEITTEKIILVQRRHTIGFIEFIRGKYDITNNEYIIKLFNMMTFDEKRLFREYDNFDVIRTIIGLKRESIYKLEYDDAKKKFNELRNNTDGNMIFKLLDKSCTRWTSPEWGIPKGRRNHKEYDIECAVREFVEETGIKYKHINVYRNVKPLEEIYKGINGVVYKHIYYLASIKENDDARMNIEIIEKGGQINYEVCNVKLFNLRECHNIIRPYYISKLNVIKKGFQLINSMEHYFE
jgi:8-oxo-dGTP pyrophosphatase MutT (NUDIX family)